MFHHRALFSALFLSAMGVAVSCGRNDDNPPPEQGQEDNLNDDVDSGTQEPGPGPGEADAGLVVTPEEDAGTQQPPVDEDAGTHALSFTGDVEPLWNTYCTPCHTKASPSGQLRLDAGYSYTALVNKPTRPSCADGGFLLVAPSDAGESMLWLKISGDSRRCGNQMPPSGLMPEEQRLKVFQWISGGAQNN